MQPPPNKPFNGGRMVVLGSLFRGLTQILALLTSYCQGFRFSCTIICTSDPGFHTGEYWGIGFRVFGLSVIKEF